MRGPFCQFQEAKDSPSHSRGNVIYSLQNDMSFEKIPCQVTLRSLTTFSLIASRYGNVGGFQPPPPGPGTRVRETRIVAPQAVLLAISDAPLAFIAHWRGELRSPGPLLRFALKKHFERSMKKACSPSAGRKRHFDGQTLRRAALRRGQHDL